MKPYNTSFSSALNGNHREKYSGTEQHIGIIRGGGLDLASCSHPIVSPIQTTQVDNPPTGEVLKAMKKQHKQKQIHRCLDLIEFVIETKRFAEYFPHKNSQLLLNKYRVQLQSQYPKPPSKEDRPPP